MKQRHVKKMLRDMAEGRPVEVASRRGSMTALARLAHLAEQFGYQYADAWQPGTGTEGLRIRIVPDPRPEARARAAVNRARYPDAVNGGPRPPLDPAAVELLALRIKYDLYNELTGKQKLAIAVPVLTVMAAAIAFRFGSDRTVLLLTGAGWAALVGLAVAGARSSGRFRDQHAATLRAAGFTGVTDAHGRLRYVPPGGQLPGHGNPFTAAP
ncbi:hypothetical protein ACIQNG_07435 [Streptomyces sp. NPDC091377]|uniref:hypothetical protein n=1 Tax=Streptomyces sp. NPDC091377 TaxID=3365995 RepID=UPI003828C723